MTIKLATGPVAWGVDFADTPDQPAVAAGDRRHRRSRACRRWSSARSATCPKSPACVRRCSTDRNLPSAGSFIFDDFHDPTARQRLLGIAERVSA